VIIAQVHSFYVNASPAMQAYVRQGRGRLPRRPPGSSQLCVSMETADEKYRLWGSCRFPLRTPRNDDLCLSLRAAGEAISLSFKEIAPKIGIPLILLGAFRLRGHIFQMKCRRGVWLQPCRRQTPPTSLDFTPLSHSLLNYEADPHQHPGELQYNTPVIATE